MEAMATSEFQRLAEREFGGCGLSAFRGGVCVNPTAAPGLIQKHEKMPFCLYFQAPTSMNLFPLYERVFA
jgi:hypothetical protein